MFFRLNLPQKGWAKRPPPNLPRPTGQSFPGEVAVRKHGLVHWLPIPAWLRKTPTVWPAVTFEQIVACWFPYTGRNRSSLDSFCLLWWQWHVQLNMHASCRPIEAPTSDTFVKIPLALHSAQHVQSTMPPCKFTKTKTKKALGNLVWHCMWPHEVHFASILNSSHLTC